MNVCFVWSAPKTVAYRKVRRTDPLNWYEEEWALRRRPRGYYGAGRLPREGFTLTQEIGRAHV